MSSYAPLWCKSNFSFLEGASHPNELIEEARRLGLPALGEGGQVLQSYNVVVQDATLVRLQRARLKRRAPELVDVRRIGGTLACG